MIHRLGLLLAATLSLSGCVSMPDSTDPAHGHFVRRELEFEGRDYRYEVFVPAASAAQPAPIVLFLHGSGERGDDGHDQTTSGLGPYLRRHADSFPALVVFPQVPDDEAWSHRNARMALATLDAASQEFGADPKRTYLTGISMGGYGTWEIALQHPQRFAALVPVSGALTSPDDDDEPIFVSGVTEEADPYSALAKRLRHVPTWVFHGAQDDVVKPQDDRQIYLAARKIGARIRYTEYPRGNHNVWDVTYANPAVWTWMFGQQLR
jgi:predicted peptidase